MPIITPAYYYAQQGADHTIPYPAQGFDGWNKTQIPIDLKRTAVIVMHAWDFPKSAALARHVEYMHRAKKIVEERFPPFLAAVRESGVRLIHVGAGFEKAIKSFPGYERMLQKYPPQRFPRIEASEELQALRQKHWRLTGAEREEWSEEIEGLYANYDFLIKPKDNEDVVTHSNQLFELCREHGIEHLIYTGFSVNMCLTFSACGFKDMSRYGLMCSVVGDLTTGVENKESCQTQANRDHGLWFFAVQSGFVFLSEDLKNTLFRKAT